MVKIETHYQVAHAIVVRTSTRYFLHKLDFHFLGKSHTLFSPDDDELKL